MCKADSRVFVLSLKAFVTALMIGWPMYKVGVSARAIMVEPPHRSSLWRFKYNTSVNVRDDGLNCGGYDWQWGVHQGRCGVCGDLYNDTQHNADHGKYDSGIIVRSYRDGHYINITFEVSSNYLGYVEFRLCPRNTTRHLLDQSCFDRYPLWIDESHGTRYYIGSRGGIYDIHIRLPGGLVCRKCVLQWKYKTGYRYNGEDGCKCLGCGRQEQFVNCADIEITPGDGWPDADTSRTDGRTGTVGRTRRPSLPWVFTRRPLPFSTRFTKRPIERGVLPRKEETSKAPSIKDSPLDVQKNTHRGHAHTTSHTARNEVTLHKLTSDPIDRHKAPSSAFLNITRTINQVISKTTEIRKILQTIKYDRNTLSPVTIVPSFRPPDILHITPTPTLKPEVDTASVFVPNRVEPVDAIKGEIVKNIGIGDTGGEVSSVSSQPTDGAVTDQTTPPTVARVTTRPPPVVPRKPNTQFVSVSNILDRFYPNYITPFLISLSRTRMTRLGVPIGCDVTSDEFRCVARGIYKQSPGINKWCEMNCRARNCVPFMCVCSCEERTLTQKSSCHAVAEFKGVEGMDQWCIANCKVGYCPANTCSVEDCLRSDSSSNGEA